MRRSVSAEPPSSPIGSVSSRCDAAPSAAETRRDVLATLQLLKDLDPDVFGIAVAFPMKGTDFYENIEPLVRPESHWTQTNENKLVFQGQYRPEFYWFAERLLHNEVALHRLVARRQMRPVRFAEKLAKTAVCRAGTKLYRLFPQVKFENAGRSGRERIPRLKYRLGVRGQGPGVGKEDLPTLTPES